MVIVVAVHDVDSPTFVQTLLRPRQKPTEAGLVHLLGTDQRVPHFGKSGKCSADTDNNSVRQLWSPYIEA